MPSAIGTSELNTGIDFTRTNQVASSPARPKTVTTPTIDWKKEKEEQMERWKTIDEEIKEKVNATLMKSAIFRDLVFGGKKKIAKEIKAMFTPE